jgi:transcriptional regulator with XRE-family HTH domain
MVALPFSTLEKTLSRGYGAKYPSNPKTIGEHIRKVRIERNMEQKDVARILNVAEDTITGWENGRSNPQISFIPSIIQFLGYDPNQTDPTTLSGRLKRYRFRLGFTPKALGEILGVNSSTIRDWENGMLPSEKNLVRSEGLINQSMFKV